jgi:dTDP-4-dehydrorhamnose reductase
MKILIIGGSGLFGRSLKKLLEKNNHDIYSTYYQNPIQENNYFPLDITIKKSVYQLIDNLSPDIVVHSASYTNVDDCERKKDLAFSINAQGTKNVAEAVEQISSKIVYISTDYIFDGKKGLYLEIDTPNPINYYGITKLQGEEIVKKICNDFIIARTSVIYGINKSNFVTWLLDQLEKKKQTNIVSDQYVSPTLNFDLAEQIKALIEKNLTGVFHTAGGERINRYDFARVIADVFSYDKCLINLVSMNEMNWIARRPKDSSLNVSKISEIKKPFNIKKSVYLLFEEMER